MSMTLKHFVVATLVVYANAQGTIVGEDGDIILVVDEGKKVGFKVGEETVLFNDVKNFPTQWRDFSDSAVRAMQLGYSIGGKGNGGTPSSRAGSGSGIPDFENLSWHEIEMLAAGGTVNFWMWDGAPHINEWVDNWLGARLQQKYQISIKRGANQGAGAAVTQVADEMKSPKTEGCPQFSPAPCGGSVDLIWINKVNFQNIKGADNLFGPWANKVPNSKNFDFFSPSIAFDAGTPTQGYEMPYNSAQVVFFHNTAKLPSPPKTVPALVEWAKKNEGRFAYSNPESDFTGAVVVQQFFYHYAGEGAGGSWKDFLGDYNEALYTERAPLVWQKLREIHPYLKLDSNKYPTDHTAIRKWFGNEDVWLDVSYDPNHATTNILNGNYENTTKSYVLDTGTIANTNFVAIPANSQNKAAALVAGNMIGSLEAIFTRAQPERWGALPAFDANGRDVVDSGWDAAFDYITTHHAAPSVEDLTAGRLTELRAEYINKLKSDWKDCVVVKNRDNEACGL